MVYAKLVVSIFCKYDITGFIYIGGNDSMDTVNKLSRYLEKRGILIAVSEGVRDEDGKYVTETREDSRTDVFGHRYIAGTGKVLEEIVRQEIGCKVRSIELNLMQRCASQAASSTDLLESRLLGVMAVQCILQGKNGHMAVVKRVKNHPYRVAYTSVPVSLVANKEKTVPLEWINEQWNEAFLPEY